MKVFLSHSTKDQEFVQTFAAELKAEKIEPWICEVDVEFGGNFVAKIEEGLRDADLTILFWSPEAARSDWTRLEWTSVTAREISESRTRLGIVLLRDCEVPELLRVKHRIDARTDPEQGRHETVVWVKRLRDMRRLAEKRAPGVFLPDPPHDFVGRAKVLEELYAALVEKHDKALLYGEPGCGKSTLALKFAWQTQGAFDAVVFQLCGQRPVAEIAAELAAKLNLDVESRPPEEQIAAARTWIAGRRTLLVLDDIWENDVKELAPGPPVSMLCTSRRRGLPWTSRTHSLEVKSFSREEVESIFRIYLGEETLEKHSDALLGFAERVEHLPIAVVVGADMLRTELNPIPKVARGLQLEKLRNEVHDVADLLRRAITARREQQRRLLNAMAVCALEGFWFPLTVEIAGLTEMEGDDARNKLVDASLLRMLDRDRQRFQLHTLLREELRNLAPLEELQAAHAAALERLFADWERRWTECRECLAEVVSAVKYLFDRNDRIRAEWLSYWGFATGRRTGELEIALRILQHQEMLCLKTGSQDGLQRSYGNRALILDIWGRKEEAMALHKKQEVLCLELGNKDSLHRSYGNQAVILKGWGRLEEAMALLAKQEALCLELGAKDGLQASYCNQAGILHTWARLEESMELYKKQQALCVELGKKNGLQANYVYQAGVLITWGRLEEAMALLKKGEALSRELGNKDGLQRSYGNQAVILQAWGRLEEAMALLKKGEALCAELGDKEGLQTSFGNQAGLLHASGQTEEALMLLTLQETLCLELGSKEGLLRSYGGRAAILCDCDRLEEAMTLLKKGEALCQEIRSKDGLQKNYCNQVVILRAWNRLEEAMSLLKRQETLCRELGNRSGLAYCYWNWGLVARKKGDSETERVKIAAALSIFVELNMVRERDAIQTS